MSVPTTQQANVRFGVATDTHYAERAPILNRSYRYGLVRMRQFVSQMNKAEVDFAIHLGDFKDQDETPQAAQTLQYLRAIEAEYARFQGPRYHVLGNHDLDSIDKATFLAEVENTGIAATRTYYSFDYRQIHFVVLDANFTAEGADHFQDFDWQLAHIPANQLAWLEQDLAQTNFPTIVFIHQLLFDAEREYVSHVQQCERIRSLLATAGNVKAVMMGHIHEEMYRQYDGIHYYVLPAMVDDPNPDSNAYALVEVTPEGTITIEGFGRVEGRVLA